MERYVFYATNIEKKLIEEQLLVTKNMKHFSIFNMLEMFGNLY